MSQILFIRHGPTEWNEGGRIQGRTNIPLSAAGRESVGRWRLPPGVAGFRWIVSPLSRAQETADLLGVQNYATDHRLQEADWGDWEGLRLKDLRAELGETLSRNEMRGLDLEVPGGESPRQVRDRLAAFLREIGPVGEPVAVVCHNGILRAAYSLAAAWDMRNDSPLRRLHSAAHLYHLSADGGLRIKQLNILLDAGDEPKPGYDR